MALDLTKPVQTRDGRPARIICTDRKDGCNRSIVALVGEGCGEAVRVYMVDGSVPSSYSGHNGARDADLVNAPVKREGWINIYPTGMMDSLAPHECRERADRFHETYATHHPREKRRIACVRIEWEQPS